MRYPHANPADIYIYTCMLFYVGTNKWKYFILEENEMFLFDRHLVFTQKCAFVWKTESGSPPLCGLPLFSSHFSLVIWIIHKNTEP